MDFIDTNLIVYANDRRDKAKQASALAVVRKAIREGSGIISVQVLQEYANTALTKLGQEPTVVLRQLALLESMRVVCPDARMVSRAVELKSLYQISFWDASILAAAESTGCSRLLTEDLNDGQMYGSIRVMNPLREN